MTISPNQNIFGPALGVLSNVAEPKGFPTGGLLSISPSFLPNKADANSQVTVSSSDPYLMTRNVTGGGYAGIRSTVSRSSGLMMASFWISTAGTEWAGNSSVGLCNYAHTLSTGVNGANQVSIELASGFVWKGGSTLGTLFTSSLGDRIDVVYNFTASTVFFRRNDSWWNNSATANPATNTGGISAVLSGPLYAYVNFYDLMDQKCRSAAVDFSSGGAIYPWGF